MKYLILSTLVLLAACTPYPDDCYVHVYVPCDDAGVSVDDDAGLQPFDPEEARPRVINVGVGDYVRDASTDNAANQPATDSAQR